MGRIYDSRKGRQMSELGNDGRNESNDSWNWRPWLSRPLSPPRRFCRAFLRAFLILAALVVAPAITGVWILIVPQYKATAEIRVRPIVHDILGQSHAIPLYDSFMNTQVSILRSPTVLQRVLDQKDVQRTEWYKNPPKSLIDNEVRPAMERLRDVLSARPRRGTELVDVSFEARRRRDAELVLNALLDQYVSHIAEMADSTSDKIYKELCERYKSLEKEIEGLEGILIKLRAELGTDDPEELVAMKRASLEEIEGKYRTVYLNMEMAKWSQKQLEEVVAKIKAKIRRRTEDEKNKSDGAGAASGGSPAGKSIADFVKAEADRERKLQTVKAQVKLFAYQSQLLLREVEKQRKDFAKTFANAQKLEKENDALRHKRRQFASYRDSLYQMDLKRKAPGSISVMTRAITSSEPSNDRRVPFTVLTLLAVFVVALTYGFVHSRRMSSRYWIGFIGSLPDTPFLGKLPLVHMSRRRSPKIDPDDQDLLDGVRIVSTSLLARIGDKPGRMVMVTSPDAGDGRSTAAILLARNLARCGVKVLLADADMRNGDLSRTFGLEEAPGVTDCLRDSAPTPEKRIFESDIPNLHIMSAGPKADRRGVEQIAQGKFAECMDRYRDDYDVILIDGPPVLPVADARVLAGQVDGSVLVVREGRTRRIDVSNALASLRSAGGKVLGAVLLGYACTDIPQEQESC